MAAAFDAGNDIQAQVAAVLAEDGGSEEAPDATAEAAVPTSEEPTEEAPAEHEEAAAEKPKEGKDERALAAKFAEARRARKDAEAYRASLEREYASKVAALESEVRGVTQLREMAAADDVLGVLGALGLTAEKVAAAFEADMTLSPSEKALRQRVAKAEAELAQRRAREQELEAQQHQSRAAETLHAEVVQALGKTTDPKLAAAAKVPSFAAAITREALSDLREGKRPTLEDCAERVLGRAQARFQEAYELAIAAGWTKAEAREKAQEAATQEPAPAAKVGGRRVVTPPKRGTPAEERPLSDEEQIRRVLAMSDSELEAVVGNKTVARLR